MSFPWNATFASGVFLIAQVGKLLLPCQKTSSFVALGEFLQGLSRQTSRIRLKLGVASKVWFWETSFENMVNFPSLDIQIPPEKVF